MSNIIEISLNPGEVRFIDPKAEAYEVISFLMDGDENNLASLKSSIPGVKVYLNMKGLPQQNLVYCEFQDIVVYGAPIEVLNGNDLGGNVNIYFTPRTNFDCFLNLQIKKISDLILSMTRASGYNFDWKTTQNRNQAIGLFPRAEIYVTEEYNVDDTETGLGSHAYSNEVNYEIKINAKFTTPSKNVIFDYFIIEHLLVDDLKRLFGKEENLTLGGTCNSFMYKGFTREIESNDEYTPKSLTTKWKCIYTQDRNYPNLSA